MSGPIGRLLTAMVTPFDEAGRVDYEGAKRLARALVDSGSDGVVVAGTTGESPTLTTEEKLRLFAEVKGALGSRGQVVAGTGNYSTAESVEMTREAERTGVDAVMAVVPYYNKPPQEGLYQHFKAIADAAHLPLILYNVPGRTSVNMADQTVIRLSQIENIAGVKEASSDMDQIGRIIAGVRKGFKVWSGNDNETFPIMCLGGYGIVSVASHLVGRQIKEMMGALLEGNVERAAALHHRLHPLFKVLFVVANPIPVKYSLNKVGFPAGTPRLPLVPPDEKSAAQIDRVLAGYTIDLPVGEERGLSPLHGLWQGVDISGKDIEDTKARGKGP
ncbi:MAG: 4-hydroxy-tetrahydrodipicolinate synthase [Chloroflexi bacterium]|nr:4-hydroxy-tetrahydrodipicolinate synthase [Chloroflexota bacterium]